MKLQTLLARGLLAAVLSGTAALSYAAPPAGWTKVANEKARFTLASSVQVAYGADSSYVTKTLPAGSSLCNTLTFLSDPKPGKVKSCYANLAIPTGAAPASGTVLAKEDKFTVPASTVVTFGVPGGTVVTRTLVAGAYRCGTELFVTDPAPGQIKSCVSLGADGTSPPVTTPPTGPGPYLATQGSTFTLTSTTVVSFGVNGAYVDATLTAGTKTCDVSTFPSDPASGLTKYCYSKGAPSTGSTLPAPTAWSMYRFTSPATLSGSMLVFYGSATGKGEKTMPAGSFTCDAATFSTVGDPAPGVTKFCEGISAQPETKIADADSNFTLATAKTVVFGKNGFFNKVLLPAGTYACSTTIFGNPAAVNTYGDGGINACFVPGDSTPTTTASIFLTVQTGTFTLSVTTPVKYGNQSANQFFQKTLIAGTYPCGDDFFGDPASGLNKSCYTVGTDASSPPQSADTRGTAGNPYVPPATTSLPVDQRNTFTVSAPTAVKYGVLGKYVQKTLVAGTHYCTDEFFVDPAPGEEKTCSIATSGDGVIPTSENLDGTDGHPYDGATYDDGIGQGGGNAGIPAPTEWTSYRIAGEEEDFIVTGTRWISFGTATERLDVLEEEGGTTCTYTIYGDAHPGPADDKHCTSISANAESKVADVGADFTLASAKTVVFGGRGFYNQVLLPAGTYTCSTTIFGDPMSRNQYTDTPTVSNGCFLPDPQPDN